MKDKITNLFFLPQQLVSVLIMKVTSWLLFVLGFLIIYITKNDARSVQLLTSDSIQDDETDSYRHRLEHTDSFQTLRWSPRKLEQSELCEFCDLIIPVVC